MASRAGFLIAALALAVPATAAAPVTVLKPSLLHVVDGVVYAGVKPLVHGTQASWSPDGSQFAFVRGDSVWIANADGSGTRKLVTGTQPAWRPDGELAYVREGTIVVAGKTVAHGVHPAFARDGRLAYDANGTIVVGGTALTSGEDPAWSPDGTAIAFVRDGELHSIGANGTLEAQLTSTLGDVHDTAWSPGGKSIVFVSGDVIHAYAAADGTIAELVRGESPDWKNVPVARELLPDLDQLAPTDIYVTRHGGRRLLAFQSAVANRGQGPVWIEGRRTRGQRIMSVWQLVRRADGTVHRIASAGYMKYDVSPTHSHWHFHPFERYELWRPHGTRMLRRDHKQGFCFGDRHPLPGAHAFHFAPGRCGLFEPWLPSVTEGTSVGYVDIYPPEFHGQWIDVTGLPPGRYVLVHRVNPEFALRERSYANDAAAALIELRRGSVRVLKRCPGSERCV